MSLEVGANGVLGEWWGENWLLDTWFFLHLLSCKTFTYSKKISLNRKKLYKDC